MEEEFLKDVVHGVARNADEAVREREGGALVVRGDVVGVGDGTSGHNIAQKGRERWLAMTVVSATDALSACDLMNNTMSVHLIRSWNGRA